jgi:hypothetical protein
MRLVLRICFYFLPLDGFTSIFYVFCEETDNKWKNLSEEILTWP